MIQMIDSWVRRNVQYFSCEFEIHIELLFQFIFLSRENLFLCFDDGSAKMNIVAKTEGQVQLFLIHIQRLKGRVFLPFSARHSNPCCNIEKTCRCLIDINIYRQQIFHWICSLNNNWPFFFSYAGICKDWQVDAPFIWRRLRFLDNNWTHNLFFGTLQSCAVHKKLSRIQK